MGRVPRGGLAALVCAALCVALPARAAELITTIDLDYTYSQDNEEDDVRATTAYKQKFEVKYGTSLTSAYDFVGAVRLELEDTWETNEAGTSRVAPTLELEAKSAQGAAKLVYEGVITTTDAYQESGESKTYSTSVSADFQVTPEQWPEAKLKLQRKREYEAWNTDVTTETIELTVLKDVSALRLEFNLKLEDVVDVLPQSGLSSSIDWSAKATRKAVLWGGTEFELSYEIKENYVEDESRGVFASESEDYSQMLKTRFKNSLAITPRMLVGLSWEYQFEQDLLGLEFDYELKNKYQADLKWDPTAWLKVTAEAKRESELTVAVPGEEDEKSLTDSLKAGFDLAPSAAFRIAGKTEFKSQGKINDGSGGSVDQSDEQKYELALKNKLGEFWDLSLVANTTTTREDGWITDRETKLKGEVKLKLASLTVTPTYETSRTNEWDSGFDDPSVQTHVRDGKVKFEYKLQLLDMLAATFSHEYGIKVEDELDEVLNFERTLDLTENTRLNVLVAEFIRGLRLEGEVERKGTDTEGDADPELVEVAWSLKLDWKLDELTLSSSLKYNDKGDTFDDVVFNSKLSWKSERLELTGEYQFEKIYAELTDEQRKLNLKLNYKF